MTTLITDIRQAVRGFRADARLSLSALASIALGIGATVFIWTIAHGVLLAAPPFPDADRLVRIWAVNNGTGTKGDLSYPEVQDIKSQARSFDAIELVTRTRIALTTEEGTERVRGESVSAGYFAMIGVRPALGRLFTAAEQQANGERVVIIGDALWKRRFSGRPDIIGRQMRARGSSGASSDRLFTIVGVMPPSFAGTVDTDVSEFWLPVEHYVPRMTLDQRRARSTWVLARLRPAVGSTGAQAEVAQIGLQLSRSYPDAYSQIALGVEPVGESWRARFRVGLLMLSGAALLLLLITCTNVAHLLLARLAQEEQNIRLRFILGADRLRILRMLLTESLLLAMVGGALGVALAWSAVALFVKTNAFRLPAYVPIAPDPRLIAAALVLVVGTALLFGTLPAWLGTSLDPGRIREAGRSMSPGRRQNRILNGLITAEVTFSFVLLIGAALLLRSYANLTRSDPGYRTANLARLAVSLDVQEFPDSERQLAFVRAARTQLERQPGVEAVSFISGVLPPWFDDDVPLAINGLPHDALSAVQRHAVDDQFLDVMDIQLRAGRAFDAQDHARSSRVALVSTALARTIASGDGSSALGRRIQLVRNRESNDLTAPVEIIGIVEDVRYHGPLHPRSPDYDLYVPITQAPGSVLSIAVHTTGDPARALVPLQRALGALAPTSPQHWVNTMESELQLQYGDARLYAWLISVFAGSALLVSILGIYAVVSNSVNRRLTEFGIRMAVGGRARDIIVLVLQQGARPLLLGVLAGGALALMATGFARALLFGVQPTDPVSFMGVGVGLLAVGFVACFLPARRAARLDPAITLRGASAG